MAEVLASSGVGTGADQSCTLVIQHVAWLRAGTDQPESRNLSASNSLAAESNSRAAGIRKALILVNFELATVIGSLSGGPAAQTHLNSQSYRRGVPRAQASRLLLP
jgi:hypothetical protein